MRFTISVAKPLKLRKGMRIDIEGRAFRPNGKVTMRFLGYVEPEDPEALKVLPREKGGGV